MTNIIITVVTFILLKVYNNGMNNKLNQIERNVSKVQLWQNNIMMTMVKPEEVDGILESWKSRGLKYYDGGHYIGFETPEFTAEMEKVRIRREKREARRLAKLGIE